MRASEFIVEAKPQGKLKKRYKKAMGKVEASRDVGGYDRTNHAYRMGMAMAMADGQSTKPVDMDSASWIEKYNTIHPYTDAEDKMVKQAMKTIPTDHHHVSTDKKSRELDTTNKVSPVSNWNKKKTKTSESATVGAISTADIGANTAVARTTKQKKKKDGTAVNALNGDSIFARPVKRT